MADLSGLRHRSSGPSPATGEKSARFTEPALRGESGRVESRLRQLLETTNAVPWEADAPTWRFTYVGPQAVKLLGYPLEAWYAEGFWASSIHPDDRQRAVDFCAVSSQHLEDYEFEYRMVRADGRIVWLHDIVNVVREHGVPRSLRGFMIDVSERKGVEESLRRALQEVERLKNRLQEENIYLRDEINLSHNFQEIVGSRAGLKRVLHRVEQVAPTDATVLIEGETGTGKELVARAIHNLSRRKKRPLVKVNCAALPPSLIESELFGHEKGAFTGAVSHKMGRFQLADGGTIFLDEVGDLSPEIQAKLLRVLQEGTFERVGNPRAQKVDVRAIAATNRRLLDAVRSGEFRQDLYYRLNVFPIMVPPLRERRGDIPLLVEAFAHKFGRQLGKEIREIPQTLMRSFVSYSWPGNVRELENVIERAVILAQDGTLRTDEPLEPEPAHPATTATGVTLREVEAAHIRRILGESGGRIEGRSGAAARLGMNASTLRSRMKKLGIRRVVPAAK